ncbi:hypothetical protein COCNU_15G000410 [Cocos nucifera]|uniref:AB hydrolase-1 domain-containing protein n=1 Tax=Cocos nucifera TaxID=13894 RepID=A0A8K0IWA9_COCNU|nr:hypothetical protein COCNU_15G000410 [Cocos nucifera]
MLFRAAAVLLIILLGLAYQSIQPPPPKLCGSPDGPPITSPRIQLKDGRHLAYKEAGTPKEKAKYKIITAHAFGTSKEFALPVSQALVEELGIYFLSFDRAGYGESDPNPKRSVKSEAMDIEELADQLEIGPKFYVLGVSMGGYTIWGCLRYIPHRLAGAGLVVPVINYWWPSFPAELSKEVYGKILVGEQWSHWIAHHFPSLLYGWLTQKWFPSSAAIGGHPDLFPEEDKEILQKFQAMPNPAWDKPTQQGVHESLHRDLMVAFGKWEFDPMNISNPFPHNEGSVHIWQGYKDRLCRVELQRYVSKKLPWIRYHEEPNGGHMFMLLDGYSDKIVKELLLGEKPSVSL